jgi:hypothetical protein
MKVLFVTAFGRSGTTLLDNIVGQLEGFFSLGEVSYVWDRAVRDDLLCACGDPFSACRFWSRIAGEAFAGLDRDEVERLISTRDRLGTGQVAARALSGGRRRSLPEVERYARRVHQLYEAVRRATGSRVLVDSSKAPPHGFVLERIRDVELFVLHMIRDPRAVAYSWQKKKVYDPSGEEPMYMTRLSARRSCALWLKWNIAAELMWSRWKGRYLRLRYEDFVQEPRATVEGLLSLLGEGMPKLPFSGPDRVRLEQNHTVGGNPIRFDEGLVEIRRDDDWKDRLPRSQRAMIAAATWPLLLRYGYRPFGTA